MIDHLRQGSGDKEVAGQDRPFGSVFTRNLSRSVWTIHRVEGQDERIEFVDRKANHRKRSEAIQMDVKWDDFGIRIDTIYQQGRSILEHIWGKNPNVNPNAFDAFSPA